MSEKEDFKKIEQLKYGESCTVNWHEEGGGMVFNCNGMYVLFSIPQYGGNETYEGTYFDNQINDIIKLAYSWS